MYETFFRKALFPAMQAVSATHDSAFMHEYEAALRLSRDEIESIQLEKLKRLLSHAEKNTVYYNRQFKDIGFSATTLRDISDVERLPILTKHAVSNHFDELRASGSEDSNIRKSTGGSTGSPFHFELDMESHRRREAVMWRGYGWLGAKLGVSATYLWGATLGQQSRSAILKENLYNRFYNRRVLNSFHMSEKNIGGYVKKLNQFRSKIIVAYVNPLVLVAQYVLENDIDVYTPEALLTGAEPLYEHQRELIEKAFKAPVYNTYGCREVMLIAAECAQQNGLHINSDHLLVETVDANGKGSVSGDILLTDLHNYGFPLIRYANGDRATRAANTACACGNPLPMLQSIDGRVLDVIKTKDGKHIPGEFFPHMIKDFDVVRQFQVRQKTLDGVELLLQVQPQGDLSQIDRIIAMIQEVAGQDFLVQASVVDEIPLTSSGKFRVTVSELED